MRSVWRQVVSLAVGWGVASVGIAQAVDGNLLVRRSLYDAAVEREIFDSGDARVLGLASAGVALDDGPQGLFWNPASLAGLEPVSISLTDEPVASRSVEREGSLALSGNLTSLTGEPIGSIGAASWAHGWGSDLARHRTLALGYASPKENGLSFGVGLRFVRRAIGSERFAGTGMDGGLHYRYDFRNGDALLAGASATNFGMRLDDRNRQAMPLWMSPPLARFGIAYRSSTNALLATQLTYAHDTLRLLEDRYRWHVGFEQGFLQNRFAVRTGYTSTVRRGHVDRGLWAFGASARLMSGRFDYAFATGGDGLGGNIRSRHVVSMSVAWAGVPHANPAPAMPAVHAVAATGTEPAKPILNTTNPYVAIRNEVFSPNGDGLQETTTFVLSQLPATWRFEITDAAHNVVRSHRGTPGSTSAELDWNGKNVGNRPVPDGLYYWRLLDGSKETEPIAKGVVTVDTTAPALAFVSDPLVLVKGSDSSDVRFRMRADDGSLLSSWELRVVGGNAATLLASKGGARLPSSLVWRNWRDVVSNGVAPMVELVVVDEAGNRAQRTFHLPVVDLRKVSGRTDARGIVVPVTDGLFVDGSDRLRDDAQALIGQLAVAMQSASNLRLTIEQGANPVSRAVSTGRVEALRSAFQRAGVAASRLDVRPGGASDGRMMVVLSGRPELPAPTLTRTPRRTESRPTTTEPATSVQRTPAPSVVEPSSSEVASTPNATRGRYSVLVGSFREQEKAAQLAREVTRLQLGAPARVESAQLESGVWYRVLVGEFTDRESAAPTHQTVRERVNADAILFAANPE
jgi:cell division septation protein DedD